MLKRLLGLGERDVRRRTAVHPPWPVETLAPERTLYAVGDIHGRVDLLRACLVQVLEDAGQQPDPCLVFLGDYVDRGENSREVLELLSTLSAEPDVETVFLTGNHEAMMLGFLADPEREARWLRFGGLPTLMSYGVIAYETTSPGELMRIRDEFADAVSVHRPILEQLGTSYRSGNVFCAHAGADPTLPVSEQSRQALVWGDRNHHRDQRTDVIWVVHGHWRVPEPTISGGRIAIDTGAYATDRLTVARISPGELRLFGTTPSDTR